MYVLMQAWYICRYLNLRLHSITNDVKYILASWSLSFWVIHTQRLKRDFVNHGWTKMHLELSKSNPVWYIYEIMLSNRVHILNLRRYEKATKFEKISHLFWQNGCFYSVASKQVGYFFNFVWPFQKSWTLNTIQCLVVCTYQLNYNIMDGP